MLAGFVVFVLLVSRTRAICWIYIHANVIRNYHSANLSALAPIPLRHYDSIPVINPFVRCDGSLRESNNWVNSSFPWHSALHKADRNPRHKPATPHIVVLLKALQGRDGHSAVALASIVEDVMLWTIHRQKGDWPGFATSWKEALACRSSNDWWVESQFKKIVASPKVVQDHMILVKVILGDQMSSLQSFDWIIFLNWIIWDSDPLGSSISLFELSLNTAYVMFSSTQDFLNSVYTPSARTNYTPDSEHDFLPLLPPTPATKHVQVNSSIIWWSSLVSGFKNHSHLNHKQG